MNSSSYWNFVNLRSKIYQVIGCLIDICTDKNRNKIIQYNFLEIIILLKKNSKSSSTNNTTLYEDYNIYYYYYFSIYLYLPQTTAVYNVNCRHINVLGALVLCLRRVPRSHPNRTPNTHSLSLSHTHVRTYSHSFILSHYLGGGPPILLSQTPR